MRLPERQGLVFVFATVVVGCLVRFAAAEDLPGVFTDRIYAWGASTKDSDAFLKTANSANLAWGESYVLRAFMSAYRLTGDTYWLRRVCTHADSLIAHARDFPEGEYYDPVYADGYLGWGCKNYSDQYDEYMVHDGHVTTPVAAFVAEVYKDSTLWDEFGARAQTYFAFIADNIAAKWLAITPRTSSGTGETLRLWRGWSFLPHNQYAAFASLLLFLDDAANTPRFAAVHPERVTTVYGQRAREMGTYFRSRLQLNPASNSYSWAYLGYGSGEDASHANLELELAWWLNERGAVFTDLDMERFARTLTTRMWNKSFNPPLVNKSTEGNDDWTGAEGVWGWSLYSKFDPLLWRILERYYSALPTVRHHQVATLAHLQRFRDVFLNSGIILPEGVIVIDDGDQVLRPGERAKIGISVRNVGVQRDSAKVWLSQYAPLVIAPGGDTTSVVVEPGASARATFDVQVPGDVATRQITIVGYADFLPATGSVTTGYPDVAFVEGLPGADGLAHNQFYSSLTTVAHRWVHSETDTFTTVALRNFDAIVWRAAWAVPAPQQRDSLAKFLDMGGNLLITGGGVLPAWIGRSTEDSLFFARYFKVTGAIDVYDSLQGLTPSVRAKNPAALSAIGGSKRNFRTSPPIHFDVLHTFAPEDQTIIFAATDAQLVPKMLPDSVGGVGIDSTYNALLFGWDFDDVSSVIATKSMITYLLAWFKSPTSVESGGTMRPTPTSALRIVASPNPFNPATTITARGLAQGIAARIAVTNVLGQECWSSTNARPGPEWSVVWNGRNQRGESMGTGTYFVIIEQGDARKATRIQLVR